MSTEEPEVHHPEAASPLPSDVTAVDTLAEAVTKVALDATNFDDDTSQSTIPSLRPARVYTRAQLLHLCKSPLVKPPDGMPTLKDWFGDWNEQQSNTKKDAEAANGSTNARDRRFRRDLEDGDAPARPSFRATLSQPSQMGNFRHQSLRTTERDREKDLEKERERDLRDKEGQERLRSLSDKYDRERLAQSTASANLRHKERDSAPHLASATSRLGQAQSSSVTTRRAEGRDTSKRKLGESSDDWRRGPDSARTLRDDNPTRRDRDRPRSRVRETSRSRRDVSTGRRDREDRGSARDRRGDDRDFDDFPSRDRDRDDPYRERFDGRRDVDRDRDLDDDPRRWRDDGRREERLASRRDRDRVWDRHDERDRERPSAGEDRDARTKRGTPRERRDEGKDQKEAEPAWMETYVPTTPGNGILGAKLDDGELDGIQAWKKNMKEKERREKGLEAKAEASQNDKPADSTSGTAEGQLDEIQLFKLMMKREAEKKDDQLPAEQVEPAAKVPNAGGLPGSVSSSDPVAPEGSTGETTQSRPSDNARILLVGLASGVSEDSSPFALKATTPTLDRSLEKPRLIQTSLASSPSTSFSAPVDNVSSPIPPSSATFTPPNSSRLLAFGSRAQAAAANAPDSLAPRNLPPLDAYTHLPPPGIPSSGAPKSATNPLLAQNGPLTPGGMHQLSDPLSGMSAEMGLGNMLSASEPLRNARSFSPHASLQGSQNLEAMQDLYGLNGQSEAIRRAQMERANAGFAESGGSYLDLGAGTTPPANGPSGSRFAKFFDAKAREIQGVPARKMQPGPGYASTSPHPGLRQEAMALNGAAGGVSEARTMEDIFAMLQSSAQPQGHRVSPQIPPSARNPYAQAHADHPGLQQQLHQQQQYAGNNGLDSLYESRVDDRFVPDGMVPGLRPSIPRSRSREASGVLFNEAVDDPLHFNVQRQQALQVQRNLEQQMYGGQVPSYSQQPGLLRNGNIPHQQAQFRNAPSPIANQHPLLGHNQRLPQGLANLGGRPPHDPSQYMGNPMLAGGHSGLHNPSPAQQIYNNFTGGGVGGYGGNPQVRGGPQHQLGLNPMTALNLQNNAELRSHAQAQLMGMGGNGLAGGLRNPGPGFGPQHGLSQAQSAHLGMRQQHIPPHLPQMLPPHLQQQQGLHGTTSQNTQDLMTLLLSGRRE